MTSMPDEDMRRLLSSLPYSYKVSAYSIPIKEDYARFEGKNVSVAGRVLAVRKAGKLLFADVMDSKGKIQAYFDYAILGESTFDEAKRLNPGDIIGVKGVVFKTNPGEISVKVSSYALLSKAMRGLPDKWHGIQDVETRYRKRHLDLIMNPEAREVFVRKSRMIRLIQSFLDKKGFIEFETPIIQPLYGGADAEPFRTHVNTLDESHYLRISDELYLKRLIIGGFDKVYEICRDFRNEDIDSTHSPEFTMIEWYQAYADYKQMMRLTESMISQISRKLLGTDEITYQGRKISLKAPFRRISFVDSINERLGNNADIMKLDDEQLFILAENKGIRFDKGKRNRAHAYAKLFDVLVQPGLEQPTFVIDFPRETSPLTRPKRGKPKLVERFELFIAGMELANAYSELNNPIIQKENFEAETKKAEQGDREAEPLDMDFVEAMEHGMPPTGGVGVGIDRLVMLLTDKASIKEVILFPMERRQGH
ncbi:MAG: lysine--tRNA ligase [Candidatus Micrarchaeota archaeon]|nr:lysine--tRNA ligase [Candidatus Micrarchaeota archaeon]